MNWDLIFAIIFYGLLFAFFMKYRSKFEIQNKIFALYRTQLGLKLMDKISKRFPRFLNFVSYISIVIGFAGMVFIFYFLIKGTINMILKPASTPILSPVLPGIQIPGLPVLSFWHWIIAILLIATIHEFSHGVFARLNDIKIKSSGFAFLGPILAAFVEPDEKQMEKKSTHAQLSVMSGGPFSNILFAAIIVLFTIILINPLANNLVEYQGVQIIEVVEGMPLSETEMKAGDQIEKINDIQIKNPAHFVEVMESLKVGDKINIQSNGTIASIILAKGEDGKPKLGVSVAPFKQDFKKEIVEKYGLFLPKLIMWFVELFFWLYAISLGIGLFNLLPLGPVDGGKMFYLGALAVFKNKKVASKMYTGISLFCLLLIVINLLPYIIKLLKFIISPILLLL